jgi:non-heme chloroperoxidase
VLRRPGNKHRAVSLTRKQFRYGFGNALPEVESDALFERWSIPGPGRLLFEAASANLQKDSPARVDTARHDRGPLLLIAGGRDHTAPEVLVKGTLKLYSGSQAVTDYRAFPDRGHSLVFDHGWREVADRVLDWIQQHHIDKAVDISK